MAQQTINLGAVENDNSGEGIRDGGLKINANFTEIYDLIQDGFFVLVDSKDKLPTPVSNVITLLDDVTYYFTKHVDLTGDRLISGENTTILGASSENCSITSTGLGIGIALITGNYTVPIRHTTIKDVDTALDLDGTGNTMALDWTGVNFLNIPNVGTVKEASNFIYSKGAFLNSQGLKFDGTVGTIGIDNSLFVGNGTAGNIIEILPTAVINTRFRVVFSSIVAFGSTVGIDMDASATINDETFILNNVNFSGGGTYLGGVDETSNKSLFVECIGITNTAVNGQLYMQNNATVTTISSVSTFVKILGTTTPSADNSKFSHANNRLTCDASLSRKYLIQCNLSFTSGNNKVCEFGFYDSKLGAIRTPSRTKSTSNGSGRSENISFNCVVSYESGDYLEIWCANNTDTTDITVTDMNFVITEII